MGANSIVQPGLFDLGNVPEGGAEPPKQTSQPPLDGTTQWVKVPKKTDCADCWTEQAADHAAGKPPKLRMAATRRMVTGSDQVDLCTVHAMRRGWKGVASRNR